MDLKVRSEWIVHVPFANWLVKEKDPKLTVDLGTYQGVSTLALSKHNNGRVVTIDMNQDTKYTDAIRGVYPNTEILEGKFSEFVDRFEDHSIDILHIDGDHKYESVKEDVETWIPKVAKDGVLLMHDIFNTAFIGPMFIFSQNIGASKLAFLCGNGLGISTTNREILTKILNKYLPFLVNEEMFQDIMKFAIRKDILINALNGTGKGRKRIMKFLKEKADICRSDLYG